MSDITAPAPESIDERLAELIGRAQVSWARSQQLREGYLAAIGRKDEAREEYERIISTIQERRSYTDRQRLSRSATARLMARLASLPVIEQAKGILMAQSSCTADDAFDMLRRASQRTNVPVREIAEKLVNAQRRDNRAVTESQAKPTAP